MQSLPLEQLESLAEALLDFQGDDDLDAWLASLLLNPAFGWLFFLCLGLAKRVCGTMLIPCIPRLAQFGLLRSGDIADFSASRFCRSA